jgi:hypothetical protein
MLTRLLFNTHYDEIIKMEWDTSYDEFMIMLWLYENSDKNEKLMTSGS